MRRLAPVILLTVALLAGPPSAAAATKYVSIYDDYFSPANVYLAAPGDSAFWTNRGADEHTTTRSGVYPWNSGTRNPGQTFSKAFIASGSYAYFCAFHSGMVGRVWVPVTATPTSGTTATIFTIRWASVTAPAGHRYRVERKISTTTTWSLWRQGTAASSTFQTTTKGTWQFRAVLQKWNGSTWVSAGYSAVRNVVVA